jgi:hypothetical protein
MRYVFGLMLLALTACSGASSGPAPCNPPMFIDSTGNCVSQPAVERRR